MSNDDFLKGIQFNFEPQKDIPELFTRCILLQSENIAYRQLLLNYLPDLLYKTEKDIMKEIDDLTDRASKELWAQFAVERGE